MSEQQLITRAVQGNQEAAAFCSMIEELGRNYQALLARKWQREDAINVATTKSAVQAVVW